MASTAIALPRPRRRPAHQPAAGRSTTPDIYFVKRIDNSRLRRQVDRQERRECYSLIGLSLVVFFLGFLCAWQHFQCVRYGYQIEQLKQKRAVLDEWNHQLRLEEASLEAPQRIGALAQQELGLAPPDPRRVIRTDSAPPAPVRVGDTEFARNVAAAGPAPGEAAREP